MPYRRVRSVEKRSGAKPCRNRLALVVVIFTIAGNPFPSEASEDDLQQWSSVTARYAVDERLTASLNTRLRFDQDISRAKDLLLRPGLQLKVGRDLTLGAGYAYSHAFSSGRSEEHRLWQDVGHKSEVSGIAVGNRLRIEQRFFDDDDSGAVFRLRGRVRLEHRLTASPWHLVVSDEVFVNLNARGDSRDSGFEQNRLYLGLARQIGERVGLEVGYQFGYQEERDAPDQISHAIVVSFVIRLNPADLR